MFTLQYQTDYDIKHKPADRSVSEGYKIKYLPELSDVDHDFNGWYDDDILVTVGYEITKDTVLVANWTDKERGRYSLRITIDKLEAPTRVPHLYHVNLPELLVKSGDTLALSVLEETRKKVPFTGDTAAIKLEEARSEQIITVSAEDTLNISATETPHLRNVHTIMKEPTREILGKVRITYTDPLIPSEPYIIDVSSSAYNSKPEQILNMQDVDGKYFTLYENDLEGVNYILGDANSHVGWTSGVLANDDGTFTTPQYISIGYTWVPMDKFEMVFGEVPPKDFDVIFTLENGTEVTKTFTNNTDNVIIIEDDLIITDVKIIVYSMNVGGRPVVLLGAPSLFLSIVYEGYSNISKLISIDLLEELTYEDDVEAIGGVSANELTVILDNTNRNFFYNSGSAVSKLLRRNRKIEAWLGIEVLPGEQEWYSLGTYWSYKWDVPVEGLTATVTGFDTISLLDLTTFSPNEVLVDTTLGDMLEYVLDDAQQVLTFLEYDIDPALYDIHIPYAWSDKGSHAAALRQIAGTYPMHIYCDRKGRVVAKIQKLHLDWYYDEWADDTNVISKDYSSIYTTVPNAVSVDVTPMLLADNTNILQDTGVFMSPADRTYSFQHPYVSDINVIVDCDSTVSYTYDVYSWGLDMKFTGTGEVRNVECTGTALVSGDAHTISYRNEDSILHNGEVSRQIQSQFIQTDELANEILNRFISLEAYDKYDVSVKYRGDISLTINDPIHLLNGIAPDNRYNIKRHQLTWNGGLTGSAELNT